MKRKSLSWKQILCILLALIFVTQLVPAPVLAEMVSDKTASDVQELKLSADTVVATEEAETATILGEVEELREENVKHFRLSDGSFIATQYSEPVHYKDANGDWKDIDNTLNLQKIGDEQKYTAQMGKITKCFAKDLSEDILFEISYEDYSVGMSLIRADAEISRPVEGSSISAGAEASLPTEDSSVSSTTEVAEKISIASVENPAVEASVVGLEPNKMSMPAKLSSGIKYSNAYKNTDIAYENRGYDIKESIIVNSPQKSYNYAFGIDAKNLTAELNDVGAVEFKNAEGETVFIVPAPYMVDANGVYSEAARYELVKKNGTLTLNLTVDAEWMNAQERAFPVTIDPSIYLHYKSDDLRVVCLRKSSPNDPSPSNGNIYCGRYSDSSYGVCQMGIQVDTLPTVPKNCVIVNAQMMVAFAGLFANYGSAASNDPNRNITISAYRLKNTSSNFLSLTWNGVYGSGGLEKDSTVLDYKKLNYSNLGGFVSWDVTPAAKEWYNSSNRKGALIFVSENENSQEVYASFVGHRWYDNSPYFIVNYRNTVGVESYYTYQTVSAARAGTVHISDYSNNITLMNTDVSYSTEAISAEISHVYNTAYANQHFDNDSANMNTQDFSAMKVGLGCKLSIQQTLKRATIGDTEYMIYNDADGTEHYFPKTATNTYEDEDGLGLKIVYKNNQYIMTDTDAYNTWTFSLYGYLISIADSNGNKTNINYSNGHITSVTVQADGGYSPTVATLTYDANNYLTKITDYRGNVTQYSYSPAGKLSQITYADGTIVNYYYTTDGYITKTYDSESGYGLRFTYWNSKRLNCVTEYTASSTDANGANDVPGNAFHVYKPSEQLATYRFYGPDHTKESSDDVLVNYVFDYSGRTICTYETDSTKSKIIGSSAASYTQNSGTSGKNNRLNGAGAMGMMHPSVYTDGGFEYLALAKSVGNAAIKSFTDIANKYAHTGRKSLGITLSDINSAGAGYVKATLTAGQTYTVSCYVLNCTVENWNPSTAYGQIKILNSSGTLTSSSGKFTTQTSRSIEKGWARVSYTFTPTQGGLYYIGMEAGGFNGKYYVDDIQVEKGELSGSTNLVQNGKPSGTSGWSLNGASYDSSTASQSPFGAGVIKMVGSPSANRSALQNVPIYDNEPGTYILSGWGKATAVGSTENEYDGKKPYFGLLAAISYVNSDGTTTGYSEWHYVPFNKDYNDWQYASGVIIPKQEKAVNAIQVYAFYTSNANTAYFDNISLVREPCSSYSYDDKGNPVSAKEGGAKTKCEYQSGTSILTKYTASTGVVTNFTYESGTHNLLTTTSAGITSANTYNEMGLVTESVSHDTDWNLAQQSSATYGPFGNKTSSTDVNNIKTTNGYYNHFLWSTQTGDMATQSYRYDVPTGRMSETFMSGYAIQHYLYNNGQLSDLSRKGKVSGNDFWQSYHFEYDSFGNMTRIGVSSANNTTAPSVNQANYRTLASYDYEKGVNNGRLSKMTYGNGQTVNYEYDIFDRTTKETYNKNTNNEIIYNYAYDASGALEKQWSSTGEEYRYEYDSLGRLIRSSEYNNSAFNQRTEHIYDNSDRLTRQAWYNGSGATSQTYAYSNTTGLLTELGVYYPGNTYIGTPGATNTPSVKIAYSYNGLNKLSGKTVSAGSSTIYSTGYEYRLFFPANDPTLHARANQVSKLSYGGSLSGLTRQYTYDGNGNIATEQVGGQTYSYEYDKQNQLTKAVYPDGTTYSYEYDTVGNIRKKTDGGTTHNYAYNDAAWADLLTSYDGHNIAYEGQTYANGEVTGNPTSGNPTRYYNGKTWNMEWENGRELSRITRGSKTWDFTYDMAGVRSGKTVTTTNATTGETSTTEYKYTTLSGKLVRVEYNTTILDIVYDESGNPFSIRYKSNPTKEGVVYYYVLNVQGDVVGLLNSSGELVVEYKYDPWGKLLDTTIGVDESNAKYDTYNNMALRNPLRYRGYIYDRDTGLYYLQSRYYDPAIGRFINADTYTTTDAEGLLSTNMFAYCENNPVMGSDPTGEWVHLAIGAAIGAAVNVATSYINHKIAGEKYTLKEAAIDVVSGAASGALAASGVGLLGQVVGNGAISEITYLARCDATKTKITISGMKQSLAIGIISGFIGGKGVDGKRLIGEYNTTKQNLKTAVSPKKISLYKGRISRYKTDAAKGTARFVLANIFSNSYDNVRKQLFS